MKKEEVLEIMKSSIIVSYLTFEPNLMNVVCKELDWETVRALGKHLLCVSACKLIGFKDCITVGIDLS